MMAIVTCDCSKVRIIMVNTIVLIGWPQNSNSRRPAALYSGLLKAKV